MSEKRLLTNTTKMLAEELREVISSFVRNIRITTATVRTSQHETMELLDTYQALSIAELARLRGVKHQSMRLVINEMELQGLVKRQKSPHDARAQLIVPSENARTLLAEARTRRAEWIAQRLDTQLSEAEREDLQQGLAALRKLF